MKRIIIVALLPHIIVGMFLKIDKIENKNKPLLGEALFYIGIQSNQKEHNAFVQKIYETLPTESQKNMQRIIQEEFTNKKREQLLLKSKQPILDR